MAAFQLLQLSEEYEKLSLWGPASLLSALVSPVVIYDRVQTLVLHCALLTQGDTFYNLLTVLPNLAVSLWQLESKFFPQSLPNFHSSGTGLETQ